MAVAYPVRMATSRFAVWLMLYWALVAPASILYFIGVKGLYSTLFALGAIVTLGAIAHCRFRVWTLAIATGLVVLALGNMVHWGDVRYIFYCLFLICAVVLTDLAGESGIERFCSGATTLMTVLVVGAAISVALGWLGAPPAFAITNPDGQDYYFFYTGFTNSYHNNIVRAAAIYDEPGALSMYLCFVAALRHLLHRDRRITWILLTLGFTTFSLAHLIYVMCHFLAEQPSKKRIILFLSMLLLAMLALITTITRDSEILLFSRLALTEDTNLLAGNNRSFQMFNAWEQITEHPSSIFFGLDQTCVFDQTACQEKFGLMGENPLSPIAFGGLSSQLPYYFAVICFLASPILGKRYIVLLGIGLLFLQRPYVTGFSYALIAVVLLHVLMHNRGNLPIVTRKRRASARPMITPKTPASPQVDPA